MVRRGAFSWCVLIVLVLIIAACGSGPGGPQGGAFQISVDADQLSVIPLEEALISVALTPASDEEAVISWEQTGGPTVTTLARQGPTLRFLAPADAGAEQVVAFRVRAVRAGVTREATLDVTVETFAVPAVVQLAEPAEEGEDELLPLSDIDPSIALLPWNVLPRGAPFEIAVPSPTGAAPRFDEYFAMKLYGDGGFPDDVTASFEYDAASAVLRVVPAALPSFHDMLQAPLLRLVVSGYDTSDAAISFQVDFRYGYNTIAGTLVDEDGRGLDGEVYIRGEFTRITRQVTATGGTFTVADLPHDTYTLLHVSGDGKVAGEAVFLEGALQTTPVTMTALDLTFANLPPADSVPTVSASASSPERNGGAPDRARSAASSTLAAPLAAPSSAAVFLGEVTAVAGAQGVRVSSSGGIVVPRGTSRLVIRATVVTTEYPEYTTQQSRYNDTWSYAFEGGSLGAVAKAGSVNGTHAASAVYVESRTFEVASLTADGDVGVGIAAMATNIGDDALPTTTIVQVYAESAEASISSLRHVAGAGFAASSWHVGAASAPTRRPLSLEMRYSPASAVISGVECEARYADAAFPMTAVGGLASAAGKATFTLGFASASGMSPVPFLSMTISCTAQARLADGSTVTTSAEAVKFGDTTAVVPLFDIGVHASSVPRYGDRDVGGDGWARAHVIQHVAATPYLRGLSVNDMSREHGGCFVKDGFYESRYNRTASGVTANCKSGTGNIADHATHQAGLSADMRYTPLGDVFPANGNPTRAALLATVARAEQGNEDALDELIAWVEAARFTITQASEDARVVKIHTGLEPYFVALVERGRLPNGTVIDDLGAYTLPAKVSRVKDHDHHIHIDFGAR